VAAKASIDIGTSGSESGYFSSSSEEEKALRKVRPGDVGPVNIECRAAMIAGCLYAPPRSSNDVS